MPRGAHSHDRIAHRPGCFPSPKVQCGIAIWASRLLDRVATHILAFEEDGSVNWFLGNFSDYEADRRKRLGQAADTPHRLKHRSLKRC